jgi:hypothetical protein
MLSPVANNIDGMWHQTEEPEFFKDLSQAPESDFSYFLNPQLGEVTKRVFLRNNDSKLAAEIAVKEFQKPHSGKGNEFLVRILSGPTGEVYKSHSCTDAKTAFETALEKIKNATKEKWS